MDLTFSEMSVDTSLAQEYLKKNEDLLELYNNYNEAINKIGQYNGKEFSDRAETYKVPIDGRTLLIMASLLKENTTLIMQLEYHTRNIPLEDTNAQLSLLIQYLKYLSQFSKFIKYNRGCRFVLDFFNVFDPLLKFGSQMCWLCSSRIQFTCLFKETAAICHLLVTLLYKAGYRNVVLKFEKTKQPPYENSFKKCPVEGWDSGTVAVVSEDADVDSAVDKFISVSKQVPWRLKRILVQESVYQTFKDALNWKCNLKKSSSNTLTSNVLCSDTLTYNDRTFLIDPVELSEEDKWSVVTVEAYRTTKEMIDLVQQHKPYYLSLWTNGIAEINEVTHRTEAPVLWVNNLADFRGPLEVSAAVLAGVEAINPYIRIKKCAKLSKLCELSQSWLKLDFELRRDILCGVLDKYIAVDNTNKIYTELRNSISEWTLNSFVDVGKDYVCIGTLQPRGIIATECEGNIFSVEHFKSILLGNALIVYEPDETEHRKDVATLEDAGVPVVYVKDFVFGDYLVFNSNCVIPSRIRVSWTNSGTIFAN